MDLAKNIGEAGLRGRILAEIDGEEYTLAYTRAVQSVSRKPLFHFYPVDTEDVAAAVKWAVHNNVKLAIKGGGQNVAGGSSIEGGLLIDLRKINHVSPTNGDLVTIGGGCIFDEVYKELHKHSRLIAGGGVWVVGCGGFFSNGGYSWLSSLYGMGVDQVQGATVVLASGEIVQCDANTEPDLFWAIRGGASQFGVITEFTLKTYPEISEMFCGVMFYSMEDSHRFYTTLRDWLKSRSDRESLVAGIMKSPHGGQALMINPWAVGTREHQLSVFKPFLEDIKPVFQDTKFAESMVELSHAADAVLLGAVPPRMATASAAYSQTWPAMIEECEALHRSYLQGHPSHNPMILFESHATKRPDPTATAYPCGVQNHSYVVITSNYHQAEEDEAAIGFVNAVSDIIRKHETENTGQDLGLVSNACALPAKPEDMFKQNYPRLQRLKAKYDPNRIFALFPHIIPDAHAA